MSTSNSSSRTKKQTRSLPFPSAWLWLVDEAIPTWVKKEYSPRDTWKEKPFSKEDARFFFKGIEELSDLFTEDRPKGMPAYFQHPKYRSAYLLYFLPLQAAKFLTLFQMYPKAIESALLHAEQTGVLRVADIGSGPATASLSLLLILLTLELDPGKTLPQIEFDWFDTNADIMNDGKYLVEQLASNFPRLRNRVQVRTHVMPWWKAPTRLSHELSLTIMGHVLNESSAPQREIDSYWETIFKNTSGAGVLLAEPAARKPAQTLSKLKNFLFETGLVEDSPTRIWGPCLHAGACPLAEGRDWCHFSVPAQIPGKWFKGFSEGLGSERLWVKFSYLWMASAAFPSPRSNPHLRRVISDPLKQGSKTEVLICEPTTPGRRTVPSVPRTGRGDIISNK